MTTYLAFLRGINVGGHNRMTMDDLRATCARVGLANVRTYIQSGNVVFEADGTNAEALAEELTDAIAADFDYDVTVVVRTRSELDAVVAGQPFADPPADGTKLYVTFLQDRPEEAGIQALEDAASDAEAFEVSGREVYSQLDKDALGDGRFTDVAKKIGVEGTRRNWDVVTAVHDLAAE